MLEAELPHRQRVAPALAARVDERHRGRVETGLDGAGRQRAVPPGGRCVSATGRIRR
jgi:hypothetical protein